MKFAYLIRPHTGGTYTVFRSLYRGLGARGIDLNWLDAGRDAARTVRRPEWKEELARGTVVAPNVEANDARARALKQVLEDQFDGVFVNVLCDRVHMNLARYLPESVSRVVIVHGTSVGTYAAVGAIRGFTNATVGVSPRIREDLVQKHGFSRDCTYSIPTGIDTERFASGSPRERKNGLRLLYLGRVVDSDKGVFWLPKIMERIASSGAKLTVAGDGKDLDELKQKSSHLADQHTFLGRVSEDRIPELLGANDILLAPSRFEGLGLVLLEAMAAGCVPVVSRIKGVTDFVIDDGNCGFLFPIGDVKAAADIVWMLQDNPELLLNASEAARKRAVRHFDVADMAESYLDVLSRLNGQESLKLNSPLSIDNWRYPAGLRGGLRSYLPETLKNRLRVLRERFAL